MGTVRTISAVSSSATDTSHCGSASVTPISSSSSLSASSSRSHQRHKQLRRAQAIRETLPAQYRVIADHRRRYCPSPKSFAAGTNSISSTTLPKAFIARAGTLLVKNAVRFSSCVWFIPSSPLLFSAPSYGGSQQMLLPVTRRGFPCFPARVRVTPPNGGKLPNRSAFAPAKPPSCTAHRGRLTPHPCPRRVPCAQNPFCLPAGFHFFQLRIHLRHGRKQRTGNGVRLNISRDRSLCLKILQVQVWPESFVFSGSS